jgi:thioredoxin-like negative regulator of GroEL
MAERLAILALCGIALTVTVLLIRAWNSRRVQGLIGKQLWDDLGETPDGRATLVTFSTPSCAACHQAQAPAVAAVRNQIDTLRVIHVDAAQKPHVARAFGVLTVPSTAILAPAGHLVALNQGFAPSKKLVEQLQRA